MQVSSATIALSTATASGSQSPAGKSSESKSQPSWSSAVRITLSPAAQAMISGSSESGSGPSAAVDTLLAESGDTIFAAAVSSLKTSPPDLSTRYDELAKKKTLTASEKAEALDLNQARNARENQAFFHFASEANAAATPQERSRLMAQYNKAYTEYYDSLSPEEQTSPRYAGTRPGAVSDYASWSREAGETPDDLSSSGNPILILFDKIKAAKFNVDDSGAKSILEDYRADVRNLISTETDPVGAAALVAKASNNFSAVQSVIDKARSGDGDAFGNLVGLARDSASLDRFLSFAQTQAQTLSA